ncbi:MAG: alcohol dehydrogenase [Deltaproteobacteria bacterium]|nr:MAG: alcohol dehydrogenase [Deltaproteobacteria bacterium]
MRAIVAQNPGGPEVLELVNIDPSVVQEGEVEIQVRAFGLNKAESYYRSGNYGAFVPNQALGIEAVGEIIQDRSGKFTPGQRVVTVMGGMMFSRHGGYAERIAVKGDNVVAIDADLPVDKLAGLPEAYLTVWGALDKNLGIVEGETLLVRGATSSVGMAAVAYAKAHGVTVLATTRNPKSVEKLKQIGAVHVLLDDGEIHEKVRAIVPEGVHNALEVVGAATVKDTLKSVCRWGQVAVVGLLGGPPIIESFNLMGDLPNTVRLSFFSSGLLGSEALPLQESPLNWVAEQVSRGVIADLVAQKFTVEQIQEAHHLLDSGTAGGKIVITF